MLEDKQIIIDDQKKTIHRLQDECTEKTNVIIALGEQLKAKEQELENICKAFDIEYAIDEETGNLIGRCNKLYKKEQECEEMKKKCNIYTCGICGNKEDCNKLYKTLTEIKEIAESEIDSKEFMAIQCMLNGSVDNKNKVLEQILQKISECEGNND